MFKTQEEQSLAKYYAIMESTNYHPPPDGTVMAACILAVAIENLANAINLDNSIEIIAGEALDKC